MKIKDRACNEREGRKGNARKGKDGNNPNERT